MVLALSAFFSMSSLHVLSFHSDCISLFFSPCIVSMTTSSFNLLSFFNLAPLLVAFLLLLLPSCHQLHSYLYEKVIPNWQTHWQTKKGLFIVVHLNIDWINVFFKNFHTWESQKETHCHQIEECSTHRWDAWTECLHQTAEGGSVLWAFVPVVEVLLCQFLLISADSVDVMRFTAFSHLFILLTLLQPSHQHSSECTFIACFNVSGPVYQQATLWSYALWA
jgi:hypothetical protein